MLRNLFGTARYLLSEAIVVPRRRRQWKLHSEPFIFSSSENNIFELHPGEHIDSYIFVYGIYEHRLLRRLKCNLQGGRTYLDIGANIGNHALYLRDSFHSVHCFEPNPVALDRLRRNIDLNRATNITIHPLGLGHADAELPFRPNEDGNLGVGSFVYENEAEPIMLPVVKGDDYIRRHDIGDVDFIKIDVEGFELEVLRGLSGTIGEHRPMVAFEYAGQGEPRETFQEIISLLPGYVLAEAVRPAPQGALRKFAFAARHGMNPTLMPITEPEARSYALILAFPSSDRLRDFR